MCHIPKARLLVAMLVAMLVVMKKGICHRRQRMVVIALLKAHLSKTNQKLPRNFWMGRRVKLDSRLNSNLSSNMINSNLRRNLRRNLNEAD